MFKKIVISFLFVISLCGQLSLAADFPGRKVYSYVPVISTAELYAQRQQSIIVDARSAHEFSTLRIKNAINVPLSLSKDKFTNRLMQLRKGNSKPIVFYCNGHTCMKSYKAARRAILLSKLESVFAYDAGVFDWSRKYPNEAELLGKSPVNESQLISKAMLKKHTLPAYDFIIRATEKTEILDIRDRAQRDSFYVFSGFEDSISLNQTKKLKKFIQRVKRNKKPLYVYDAVGKQVRWLQYYLEDQGIKKYYFMQGGARAYFDIPLSKLIDG